MLARRTGKSQQEIDRIKDDVHCFEVVDLFLRANKKLTSRLQQIGDAKMQPVNEMQQPIPAERMPEIEQHRQAAQDAWDLKSKLSGRFMKKPYERSPLPAILKVG